MPDKEYEYHSREFGWLPAQEVPRGHPDVGIEQRGNTLHLRMLLPDGREVVRRNVAHEAHLLVPNILAGGRCRQCGLREENHGLQTGRVYRVKHQAPQPERETETAPSLPDPRTVEQAKAQAPKRLVTADR